MVIVLHFDTVEHDAGQFMHKTSPLFDEKPRFPGCLTWYPNCKILFAMEGKAEVSRI